LNPQDVALKRQLGVVASLYPSRKPLIDDGDDIINPVPVLKYGVRG
jgi:hypothetical protein